MPDEGGHARAGSARAGARGENGVTESRRHARIALPAGTVVRAWLVRLLLLGGIWWVLGGGMAGSWWLGGVVVVGATGLSLRLLPPVRWSPVGLLRFLPWFLWRSLIGGIDVACRALDPRLPLSPAVRGYATHLPPGLPQVFLANVVSLLPGTLSVELEDGILQVHLLDENSDFEPRMRALEQRVAALFQAGGRRRNDP